MVRMDAEAAPAAGDDASRRLALYRSLTAYLGAGDPPRICTCNHLDDGHATAGAGPCTELDSYGQPCACPAFELATDHNEDDEAC